MEYVNLPAPWYFLRFEMLYTLGEDKRVTVGEVEQVGKEVNIKITVTDLQVAKALREILPLERDFGPVKVFIIILDSSGNIVNRSGTIFTPKTLADVFCTALSKNPLFKGVVVPGIVFSPEVAKNYADVVVFTDKQVVQFYGDILSEICGDFNAVAADVFRDITESVFSNNIKIQFSTYNENCRIKDKFYCIVREGSSNCEYCYNNESIYMNGYRQGYTDGYNKKNNNNGCQTNCRCSGRCSGRCNM